MTETKVNYLYRKADSREWLPLGVPREGNGGSGSQVQSACRRSRAQRRLRFRRQWRAYGAHFDLLDGSLKRELVLQRGLASMSTG